MKRRTLDVIFSVGGTLLALLILVLGLILQDQADFAKDYVKNQLSEQKITFTPAKALSAEENAPCLKTYGGKALVSGKQAECYANNYIGVHVEEVNEGKTYSESSGESRALAAELKAIPDQNSPEALALAPKVKELQGKVDTLFKGETLRGLLLTSYGFSIFGDRAQQAALVCFGLALVLLLASIAGFIHAGTKAAEKPILSA